VRLPFLKLKKIREMSYKERAERLIELKAELLRHRATISAGGAIENPARIREIRKVIARILTIQNKEAKIKIRVSNPK
jgi:large subunit ribosomal protein L29